MKTLPLAVLAFGLVACSTKKCKDHTALVTLELDGASSTADSIDLVVSAGGASQTLTVPRASTGDSTTIEIDFDSGYPMGATLAVTAVARLGGDEVGTGSASQALTASCAALTIDVANTTVDLGSLDAQQGDAANDLSSCGTIYVSTTGDDSADGCTMTTPFATITHALAVLGDGQEIHVCAGMYTEPPLAVRGTVKGGYSCSSWARTPGYGYPSFTGVNSTSIVPSGTTPGITVSITGDTSVPTLFDGFTVYGFSGPYQGTLTTIRSSGPATISNNIVFGGSAVSSSSNGTVALDADGNEDITGNLIDGGSGITTTSATGSIGIALGGQPVVAADVPHVHGNTISAGSGQSPTNGFGSLGILIGGSGDYTAANGKAIEGNIVSGGTGSNPGTGAGFGACALFVAHAGNADVIDNLIDGGASLRASTVGVATFSEGALHLYANRIFGGKGHGSTAVSIGSNPSVGSAVVESNMILGGPTVDGVSSEALTVALSNTQIVHNTIVASSDSAASDHLLVHVVGQNALTGITIDDNILGGTGVSEVDGILVDNGCAIDEIASLHANVSFFTTVILRTATSGSCGSFGPTFTSDQDLQSAWANVAVADDNLNIAATCAGDSGCVPLAGCTSAQDCLATLFVSWDATTNGKETLESGNPAGWQLTNRAPCAVTASSISVATAYGKDFYGTTWSDPHSLGAAEHAGLCGQ